MLSNFSGWHAALLIVPVLVVGAVVYAIYAIARAGARAGARQALAERPVPPVAPDLPPSPRGDE
jgi:hypothetical protein